MEIIGLPCGTPISYIRVAFHFSKRHLKCIYYIHITVQLLFCNLGSWLLTYPNWFTFANMMNFSLRLVMSGFPWLMLLLGF